MRSRCIQLEDEEETKSYIAHYFEELYQATSTPGKAEYRDKTKEIEVKTFTVPFPMEEIKENITINTNTPTQPSRKKIVLISGRQFSGNLSCP